MPLMLASCFTMRAPEQSPAAPVTERSWGGITFAPALPPALAAFERQHRDRAEQLAREGNWANAAMQWEILALLRPDHPEYAKRREAAREQAISTADAHLQAAAEARRHGDVRGAGVLYLKVLAADPGNTAAADALREIEREQARRLHGNHWANGGTSAKLAARRRAAPAYALSAADQSELEGAVMLLHQGDYAVSAQKLRDYLRRHPHDELAKKNLRDAYASLGKQQLDQGKAEEAASYLEKAQQIKQPGATTAGGSVQSLRKDLAQDYYERGMRVQRSDLDEAIRLWERALQYDSAHSLVQLRLKQAKQMQRNLEAIDGAKPTR